MKYSYTQVSNEITIGCAFVHWLSEGSLPGTALRRCSLRQAQDRQGRLDFVAGERPDGGEKTLKINFDCFCTGKVFRRLVF